MKSNINFIKLFPLIIAGLILITSCSTYDKIVCPDLSNNRSYSKKYMASNRTKKNLYKNHTEKRNKYYAFRKNNRPRNKSRNVKDYTINQDKSYITETSEIRPIPGITEFQVPAEKDEKFDLIASSDNSPTNRFLVPNGPEIKNNNNNGPAAFAQNLSNFTKKEQREIIKPLNKEFKKAISPLVQAKSEQQANPAWEVAIASFVFGSAGLFIPILGLLINGVNGLGYFFLVGVFFAFLAIILGRIALKRVHKNPGLPGKRFAATGLVFGLVLVITFLTILILSFGGE